jgi:general secretion pathway protein G
MRKAACNRSGFTLVELVVVIMILGIIAAIALPRVLGTADSATDNGLRHSLSVVRGAIDRYMADHEGQKPGDAGSEADFIDDIREYLRGGKLPVCPVGTAENNEVHVFSGGDIETQISATSSAKSWLYDSSTGEFYINCADPTIDDNDAAGMTYDQL